MTFGPGRHSERFVCLFDSVMVSVSETRLLNVQTLESNFNQQSDKRTAILKTIQSIKEIIGRHPQTESLTSVLKMIEDLCDAHPNAVLRGVGVVPGPADVCLSSVFVEFLPDRDLCHPTNFALYCQHMQDGWSHILFVMSIYCSHVFVVSIFDKRANGHL